MNNKTDNIIVGFGEVAAIKTEKGLAWVLPGMAVTHSKREATHVATRIDTLIQANNSRYNRNLVW